MIKFMRYIVFIVLFTVSCGILNEKTIQFCDGTYSIKKPLNWRLVNNINKEADIQMINFNNDSVLVILSEHKSDFDTSMTIEQFSFAGKSNLISELKNAKIMSGPDKQSINGFNTLQYEIQGEDKDGTGIYLHIAIETKKHFHQFIIRSFQSSFQRNQKDFNEILNSIKRVK